MKHAFTKTLENVMVRPLAKHDIENLRIWRNNPDNTKFLKQIEYITIEQQQMWFADYLKNKDEMAFAIEEIRQLHRVVGSVSLYNFKEHQAELGKILIGDENAHGKNVCYWAVNAILEIAFELLNLESVILHCYEKHQVALHIYQKVGFEIIAKQIAENEKNEFLMRIEKVKYFNQ